MVLKVLLPYRVFVKKRSVTRIVVETCAGPFGLLPHRLDCTAALSPGILVYHTRGAGEAYLAVDQGVLIKTGPQVVISVRNAIGGQDLGQLRAAVDFSIKCPWSVWLRQKKQFALSPHNLLRKSFGV
jgi:F-type H+-transporting ATPase subunit epsilon